MKKPMMVFLLLCSSALFGQQVINNLQWLNVDQEIEKLTVDNGVTLYAETAHISDGEAVTITIWARGNEADERVGEYRARVQDGKIVFHWILMFDEDKLPNSKHEIETQGFTKPFYYFSMQYNNTKSHDSKLLSVRAWVRQKFVHGHGDYEPWAFRKYTLLFSDDSKIEGWTDAEGNIRPEFDIEPFGNIYWYIHKLADEDDDEGYWYYDDETEQHVKVEKEPKPKEVPEIWPPDLPPEKPIYYQVKEHDSLWKIASYDFIYGNPYLWRTLYAANKHNFVDDANPHLIETGQALLIPAVRGGMREGTR